MSKTNLEENAQEYITLLDNQKQRLEQQLSEANALIAMKDATLKDIAENFDCDSDAHKYGTTCRACVAKDALSTSPESLSAWEAEKLVPLQKRIAELEEQLRAI